MATTARVTTGVKLGKLPVRTDVRTLQLARYVDRAALPAPPEIYDATAHVPEWPMYAVSPCTPPKACRFGALSLRIVTGERRPSALRLTGL